jgi:hypothetical protein
MRIAQVIRDSWRDVLRSAQFRGGDKEWAEVLSNLAYHLPGTLRIEMFAKALQLANLIVRDKDRAEALRKITPHLDCHLKEAALRSFISMSGRLERSEFLSSMPSFFPFIAQSGDAISLPEIRRAVSETAAWFP